MFGNDPKQTFAQAARAAWLIDIGIGPTVGSVA
jgi:hypothetical protein